MVCFVTCTLDSSKVACSNTFQQYDWFLFLQNVQCKVSLSGAVVEVDDCTVLTLLCGGALAAYILSGFERCCICASSFLIYAIIVSSVMVLI